jgi:nitrogen fixation-related uncharacterized protein
MFVAVWIVFLLSGTVMAIVVLLWGMRTRQFDEQQRARYLPLVGLTPEELAAPPRIRRGASFVALLGILAAGTLVLGLTLSKVLGGAP